MGLLHSPRKGTYPLTGSGVLLAQNGAKLRIGQAKRHIVSTRYNLRTENELTNDSGERKKRLMRELDLRAIEAETQNRASGDGTRPGLTSTSKSTFTADGFPDMVKDTDGQHKHNPQEAPATGDSDLCPTVRTEKHSVPAPPQIAPTVRKVRKVFPFDMSNPF